MGRKVEIPREARSEIARADIVTESERIQRFAAHGDYLGSEEQQCKP